MRLLTTTLHVYTVHYYHGLPNLFLPLRLMAGESLYGDPLALVATPPGSWYAPGLREKVMNDEELTSRLTQAMAR